MANKSSLFFSKLFCGNQTEKKEKEKVLQTIRCFSCTSTTNALKPGLSAAAFDLADDKKKQ